MKWKSGISLMLFLGICLTAANLYAQSLPSGTCGIVYTYDAAGNRTKMEFVLNNTQTAVTVPDKDSITAARQQEQQVIEVDALYPNPTTGRITLKLVKPLVNGTVRIADMSGHLMLNETANGSVLNYDLTGWATGIYILYVEQGQQQTSIKVIKR